MFNAYKDKLYKIQTNAFRLSYRKQSSILYQNGVTLKPDGLKNESGQ